MTVLFTDSTQTGCGAASSATGPFYCPADQKVYLDPGFFDELSSRFGAPGDFAQAYVIAHEFGHHVQDVLGTWTEVQSQQTGGNANELSIRLELQADCLAGMWAHSVWRTPTRRTSSRSPMRTSGRRLNAAAAVGDDRIQEQATGTHRQGVVDPRLLRAAREVVQHRLQAGHAWRPATRFAVASP